MPDEEAGAQAPPTNHLSPEWESNERKGLPKGRRRSSILDWLKGGISPVSPFAPPKPPNKDPASYPSPDALAVNANDANPRPSKLDALFRPDRTYLGLSRNHFVLLVVVPAVTA